MLLRPMSGRRQVNFTPLLNPARITITILWGVTVPGSKFWSTDAGTGGHAFYLAKEGAKVWGIDISEEGTKLAAERASKLGVAERTSFQVMDAEALKFPDSSFDIVCGSGILHHLDLQQSMKEINRVFKIRWQGGIF